MTEDATQVRALAGKSVLVTGASRGIGKAIATACLNEGARVTVTARSVNDTLATDLGPAAFAVTGDVSVAADRARIVEATLHRFGRIDALVNNAAMIHRSAALVDFDPDLWRRVIDVNLISVALLSQAVLPTMIAQGSGNVVNVSSIGGRHGAAGRTAYRAAKAGLINLTESMAAEVHRHGVRVNCICPGAVATEGTLDAFGWEAGRDERLMDPSEIARLAVFLLSPDSSSITGSAIDAFGASNPLFGTEPPLDEQPTVHSTPEGQG